MTYEIPQKAQQLGTDIRQDQLRYHNRRVLVSKEFTFDSAHHLHLYEGKCKSMHGHTYKLQIVMSGKTDYRGLTIDFSDIKRIAKERVIDKLDHRYLNDVLPPMNTTAENMVVWIYEQIAKALAEEGYAPNVRLEEAKLWETPTSYAAVTRELMEAGEYGE
ncbi:6-carboxytetrahydropterin synthase QueD [Paenibacillus methanolicus]|uniref:6-carboxy-5,6,7,8-tetrahydropterin synthase n=1 Tax=Paenibacillus methanolicus TaxID=582686 RepID=A0A5S5C5S5_9BACL|nr:6-carboxytetrahydropterin synthase QueD [Paenibacillus methanolicus]TYP73746.1 6-pyruvoyltetrahydropterin/6-carboxytetrahydropterin synthase [Paenibacillus methanolicus]